MLRLAASIVIGFAAASAPRAQEGQAPAAQRDSAAPTLTTESRAELKLLRAVLADEGRESARGVLREMVEGLRRRMGPKRGINRLVEP